MSYKPSFVQNVGFWFVEIDGFCLLNKDNKDNKDNFLSYKPRFVQNVGFWFVVIDRFVVYSKRIISFIPVDA